MKTRQFYVAKFKSSRLKQFDYNIESSFDDLRNNGEIVSLADNQVLRSIRNIIRSTVNFDKIDKWYKDRNILKMINSNTSNLLYDDMYKNNKKINTLQRKINKALYMVDYIIIVIEHSKHYEYLFENGLYVNGKKYFRFNSSAGQARLSTVTFCSEDVLQKLNNVLDNGRNLEKELTPSKYNAYKGLSGSATHVVSKPKYCVVKDFHSSMDVKVDYVTEVDGDKDDIIEPKTINQSFNRFDGMGLISYRQSQKWAEELGLKYVPAQWCKRGNYMKGMLCTFPIHEFCEKKIDGNYRIESLYGNDIDLRDVDVILTESQFKLWDSFDNLEVYDKNCKKNKLDWGVSLFTPEKDKDILKMNYQFLQTLDLNQDDIERVCEKFVNWIKGVNVDDVYYTLLFLIGTDVSTEKMDRYFSSESNYWIKCLALDHTLMKDRHIRDKVYNMIKKKIDNGCLGNILIDGNFQVIVSDPYAMMEYVCGLEVKGLLGRKEYYSGYWNKKDVKVVDSMRAPLTFRSEHLKLGLIDTDEAKYWYRYCYTGIIVNIHGEETMNWAGSDFDYDIIATTSDETIINGVYENELPVVYDPPKAQKVKLDKYNLYKADKFAFGSKIGQITNKSTSIYPLLNRFDKDSREYKVLMNRLKMCTKLQSAQIDKFCRFA